MSLFDPVDGTVHWRHATTDEAVARYRAATDDYHQAAAHAIATRRDGWTRDAHKANAAARNARKAWEAARDELVAAALEHECKGDT